MSGYTAFISYASSDHLVAERLQRELETYKVPRKLRAELGLSDKRLGAFFRDQSDLAASHSLPEVLEEALDASSFLIVLCSPASAASEWVNAEIRHFMAQGRVSDIIPIIVSGAPDQYDAKTNPNGAFPPALFPFADSAEPLAPVIGPDNAFVQLRKSHDDALLQVIARLLGVTYGRMKDRHAEQRRRDKRARASVLAGFAGLCAAAILGWWLVNQGNDLIAADDVHDLRGIQLLLRDTERYYDHPAMTTTAQRETIRMARENLDGGRFGGATDPALALEHVWVLIRSAELAEKTYNFAIVTTMIEEAKQALNFVEVEAGKSRSALWLPDFSVRFDPPAQINIDLARIAVLDLEARNLRRQKDFARSHAAMTEAMSISQKWHDEAGAGPLQSAQSACRLGHTIYLTGDYETAHEILQDCAGALETVSAGQNAPIVRVAVDAKVQAGILARGLGDREAAFAAHQEAHLWATNQRLAESESVHARILAIRIAMNFADSLISAGHDPAEAVTILRQARDDVNILVAIDKDRADWKNDKMLVLERLAAALQYQLRTAAPQDYAQIFDEATNAISEAIVIADELLDEDPTSIDRRHAVSVMYETRAILNFNRMRFLTGFDQAYFDAALADITDVVAMREETHRRVPNDPSKEYALANAKANLSRIYALSPDHAELAFAQADVAREALQALIDQYATEPNWHFEIALLHYEGARLAASRDDFTRAREELEESGKIIDALLQDYPENGSFSLAKSEILELSEGWGNAN